MIISRRQFLLLTAGLAAAGCKMVDGNGSSAASAERTVNAGPVGNFSADRVYSGFRDQGFFVIRQGDKLFALSAICTHRNCKLTVEPDRSFYCRCHGSIFDPAGHVIQGPARRDLPVFATTMDEGGQLLVKLPAL
jgi:Rieske Fe-S protein